jgi:signal transduction histidine kinase
MRPILAILSGWIATLFVIGFLIVDGHEAALARSKKNAAAFTLTIEGHTSDVFQAASSTIAAVADQIELMAPGALHDNDPTFRRTLKRRLSDLPYARAIFVIGPDGWIRHDTDYPGTPHIPLADRPYFRAFVQSPSLDRHISEPIRSRSGLGLFVAVSQRIHVPSGFGGIVVAAMRPGWFENLYAKLGLGQGDRISLYHANGTLVARYPVEADSGVGSHDPHILEATRTRGPRATYEEADSIVSHAAVEGAALIVELRRGKASAIADWRSTAVGAVLATMMLTLALAWLLYDLGRQRRRREQAREQRMQAEKLEALGRFTGGIAHDFGNLLSILSMNLKLIEAQAGKPEAIRDELAVARRAAANASDLIERLLSFGRLQPLDVKRASLNRVVEDSLPLLRQAAGGGVFVEFQAAAQLPDGLVDAKQLEVALVNLVVNARDALSHAGRVVIRTSTCGEEHRSVLGATFNPDSYICLSVSDSGPGMGADVRRRVLEPFFTTKGMAGTGLGLSQVYGFMTQCGGHLHIESEPGSGTTVHLFFRKAP